MIFGYSTNAFKKYTVQESIEKIAALGFTGVEIMCDRPHVYPPDFGPEALTGLRAALEDNGLKPTNLNAFTLFAVENTWLPSWIEPDRERREVRIRHTLDSLHVAKVVGCPCISIPPGGPLPEGTTRKEAFALLHRGLEQVIPKAEELGVKLLVEPEPDLLMENTREIKPFVEDVAADIVGINFDIGHFYCAGEDPAAAFEELFPWIGHVHIEDIAESRVHEHLIAGEGAIDFRSVFDAMKRLDYAYDMALELYPYLENPEAAGKKSMDHLLPIMRDAGLNVEG